MKGKIKCTKCNEWFGISRDREERLVAKYGSNEALIAGYVCRSCRGGSREKHPKPVRRDKEPVYDAPEIDTDEDVRKFLAGTYVK